MKLSLLTSIICLSSSFVLGHLKTDPIPRLKSHTHNKITHTEALAYVSKFWDFLRDAVPDRNALAQELFTEDLAVNSQSRISTRGAPQAFGPFATSLADFLANSSRPYQLYPNSTVGELNDVVVAESGTEFIWIWTWKGVGSGERTIFGFTRFVDVEFAAYGGGWKVKSFAFEFDSICWLLNTGGRIVARDRVES